MPLLAERLMQAVDLTNALAGGLSADQLAAHNGKAPSNDIAGQFWCVVGARESYARAVKAGAWQGFACSLNEPGDPARLAEALAASRTEVEAAAAAAPAGDAARETILFDLLEHEAQHQGQLIRYFYANGFPFPPALRRPLRIGLTAQPARP